MAVPKWTEERTEKLVAFVGEGVVSQETVAQAAQELETSTRSIASKLRKMGYDVELSGVKTKAFSDEQSEALAEFVEDNSGEFTYKEIAENFEGGAFTAKQVQGKILSLELTDHVKPTPKPETVRTYTTDEEVVFVAMAKKGAFLEEIAAKLGKEVPSVRGKALSLMRSGEIDSIPKQRDVKGKETKDEFAAIDNVESLTVEQIAEKLSKTPRGVRTMLTRRGIKVSDYDGAGKKAKLAEAV